MPGLTPGHKRYWYRLGVKDARMSLSEMQIENHLKVAVNYYLPEHYSDARRYYLLGFRRTGRRILRREYHQRASLVG